jgi:hypothetical protein
MRAIRFDRFGDYDVLKVVEISHWHGPKGHN